MRKSHTTVVQIDARGRILLPKELRLHLGVEPEGALAVEVRDDGSVVMRDARADRARRLSKARGSFRGKGGSVDELIAARRAEAKCEDMR